MKQHLLNSLILLFALIAGGNVWADTLEEGFEKATTGTDYKGTVTVKTTDSDCGIAWKIYYGTVSTSSTISGNKSAALRLYTSDNYGYLKTTTPIDGLSKVSFKAMAATSKNAKIKVNISYSSDGSNWTNIETDKSLTTSAATYNVDIPTGGKYFQIAISSNSTKPTSKNAQLTIDDVVFTYTSVTKHTLSYIVKPEGYGTVSLGSESVAEGSTTTITANPNDGYRFTSWSVSGTGASVESATSNPTTFTMGTSDATVTAYFEAIPTHTLTVTPTSAGTITVKNGEDEVASGSSVREGTELTIIAAAGEGKKFNSWSLTNATPANPTSTETTFTVGENDVTVAANFDDVITCPVHWSVNGIVVATDNVAEGAPISFDAPESGIPAGYKFTGWAASPIVGTTTTEPNYVTPTNATTEVTYYAVLVDIKTPDELTSALTGVTGTSYTSWSGKTSISDAVYAGKSAAQYSTIQLRTKNNESGVITTTSGGKAKKVIIEWNSNTAETRTLTIYGKNTAYTAATDLYESGKAGTSLGELNVDDAVNHKSVLNITGDYEYIGIRSKDDPLYLDKISIYWNEVENYCTTVPTATINLAAACTDGEGNYYGTYSNSKAFIVPADLTVSTISVSAGKMTLSNYNAGDIVKANTGVLISATSAGDKTVTLAAGGTELAGNMLRATGAGIDANAMDAADAACKFYRLTMHEGTQIGFFWGAAEGAAFAVAANKAYLAVPNTEAGLVKGFRFGENTDAISEIMSNGENEKTSAIYDLSGRRVVKPTKGLYIVNGKKVVK